MKTDILRDSVRDIDNEFVKRIHAQSPSGHIHKGHGPVAANASIPTKYHTIVTNNSDKKGFNIKAKRFQYDSITEAPGPGRYGGHNTFDLESTSFSKKGTGGFASKSKRAFKFITPSSPGPGVYALPSALISHKDFSQAPCTGVFHKPIAVNFQRKAGTPGPNAYGVVTGPSKANSVAACAAFNSRTKRGGFDLREASQVPGPGQYSVKDKLLHESPKILSSMFDSKSKRKFSGSGNDVPGPGSYRPYEPVEPPRKLILPRKHYLCISAPAMPLPVTSPQPGPGSYDIVDYEGEPKHFMSSAAFVSTTTRWSGDTDGAEQPGPAQYRPLPIGKQSFIYNSTGRWI